MSKLLLDEQPLLVMPRLAQKIGLNESIIIQQIHYWNEINKKANNNYYDGYYWTYNSYEEWQKQFPFWCERTIKTIFTKLEKMGLIISSNFNKLKIDRTKWYRIDYKKLEGLETSPLCKSCTTIVQKLPDHEDNLARPLPETTTETTTETKKRVKGILSSDKNSIVSFTNKEINDSLIKLAMKKMNSTFGCEGVINYFLEQYEEKFKKEHPIYSLETWEKVIAELPAVYHFDNPVDLDEGNLEDMIDRYFITKFQSGCDYHLLHFLSEGVKTRRMYEVAY